MSIRSISVRHASATLLLTFVLLCSGLMSAAQELVVVSFEDECRNVMGESRRKDLNGDYCALIKVVLPEDKAAFEGDIVGDRAYKGGEYWIYLVSTYTKKFRVAYEGCEPVTITFADYGIERLRADGIYQLKFDNERLPKAEHKSNRLLTIIPSPSGYGNLNGHAYVDLGLSVVWATCNIGASSPENEGDYFAWGETKTKSSYKKDNSKTYHKLVRDIEGNAEYDVATAKWGDAWSMPTEQEFIELQKNCEWTWTQRNGINGFDIVSKINGNSIFLPVTGLRLKDDEVSIYSSYYERPRKKNGNNGYYWTSTPIVEPYDGDLHASSVAIQFYGGNCPANWPLMSQPYRWFGMQVRPVAEKTKNENIGKHDYVDLGLSVKWATCNVGADSPEDNGSYFGWGEISPKVEKSKTFGKKIDDISGNPDYDAARASWGGLWRIPTKEEAQELIDNTSLEVKGNGFVLTSNINGNSIFMPATFDNTKYYDHEQDPVGSYWLSTPCDEKNEKIKRPQNRSYSLWIERVPETWTWFIEKCGLPRSWIQDDPRTYIWTIRPVTD